MRSTFFFLVILGLLMVLSSHTWFFSWIGLEMMTFFFLPLISSEESFIINKLMLWKYFIIQFVSSSCFFLCMHYAMMCYTASLNSSIKDIVYIFLVMSMLLKLGIPPFHSWVFEISENLSWFKFFFLNTVQKLAPLVILSNISFLEKECKMILFYSLISFFTVFCLFNFSLRRFLVFSSILNVIWMIHSTYIDLSSTYNYILCYSLIMLTLTVQMEKHSLPAMSSLSSIFMGHSLISRLFIMITILSLCGIPPTLGFFIKFDVVMGFIEMGNVLPCLPLMICSILMVSMYINIKMLTLFIRKSTIKPISSNKRYLSLVNCLIITAQVSYAIYYFL